MNKLIKQGRRAFITLLPIFAFLFLNMFGGHVCSVIMGDSISGTILGNFILIGTAGFWYKEMRTSFHLVRDMSVKRGIYFVIVLLFTWFASQAGSLWVSYIWPGNVADRTAIIEQHMGAYLFLTICVAPIAEELMFRGVFYTQFRKLFNPTLACIISTVVFSCMHVTPANIYIAAISGLLFCGAYEMTDSLVYNIALHVMYNILCMTVGIVPVSNLYIAFILQVVMWVMIVLMYFRITERSRLETAAEQARIRG